GYTSRAAGKGALDLTAGAAHATTTFDSPARPAAQAPAPALLPKPSASPLHGTSGRVVAGGLVFIAVVLSLLAAARFLLPDGPSMASMISPYGDPSDALPGGPRRGRLAGTAIRKR